MKKIISLFLVLAAVVSLSTISFARVDSSYTEWHEKLLQEKAGSTQKASGTTSTSNSTSYTKNEDAIKAAFQKKYSNTIMVINYNNAISNSNSVSYLISKGALDMNPDKLHFYIYEPVSKKTFLMGNTKTDFENEEHLMKVANSMIDAGIKAENLLNSYLIISDGKLTVK